MIVLAIETAGPRGSVALLGPGEREREVSFASSRRLGAELAPTIRRVLAEAGLGPESPPDLIAVDTGPGSYTGLRIGLAAAKGLAFAWSRPLLGVPALDALEFQAPEAERVLCALDASRGEVYAALFERGAGARRVRARGPGLEAPDALRASLPGATLVIGDAAPSLADTDRGILAADPELAWPTALRIARLGRARHLEGARDDALRLAPIYYRVSEAEEKRRKRSMRQR